MADVEKRIRETGVTGGAGTGGGAPAMRQRLTQKDVKVEKLMEKATTSDFRQWQKLIVLQLDHVHGYAHMEDVIDELRRTRETVTVEVWEHIMNKLNSKTPMRYNPADGWTFSNISRFLHGYILPKLNVRLFDLLIKYLMTMVWRSLGELTTKWTASRRTRLICSRSPSRRASRTRRATRSRASL
jgi:hypothetical protein